MKYKVDRKTITVVFTLAFAILFNTAAYAFETSSSNYDFQGTVTSGSGNNPSSSNYQTYVTIGTITGSASSSNYNNEVGFIITNPFVAGEACQTDSECITGACCSNICASSCGSGSNSSNSTSSSSSSSGGGSSGGFSGSGNVSIIIDRGDCHSHFFSRTEEGKKSSFKISDDKIDVYNVTFIPSTDLKNTNIKLCTDTNPIERTPNSYNYFNITGDISAARLETVTLYFTVPIDSSYIMDSIVLKRYDSVWETLPTKILKTDADKYYFSAETTGIGLFAIVYTPKEIPRQPGEEITGEVIRQPETPATAPEQSPERTPRQPTTSELKEEESSLFGIITTLLTVLFLVIILFGLFAYKYNETIEAGIEKRRMTYLEFQNIIKDIYRHLEKDNVQRAVELYKQLMPDYQYLISSDKVKAESKTLIYKDFKLAYDIVNKRVKDANYAVPKTYWNNKKK